MKKPILTLFAFLFILFAIMALRPVSPSRENSKLIIGTVNDIREGGTKDIVFSLVGESRLYYINRGLERNLALESLRKATTKKKLEILYADHWTPLDVFGKAAKHITELRIDNKIIFSELK
ncbi:MAG: hypothetical protein H7Y13_04910 [Sphingobacteriaceae bacterium]|nr:hypothetical protein [Sphingobacteriaceae bacterium]